MQIVIDIDEWVIDWIRKDGDVPQNYYEQFQQAFINGVLLPKGHGRLIDADLLSKKPWFDVDLNENDAPIVLEADKE